jgi:hypothetical protein
MSSGFGERSSGVSLQLVDQLARRRLGLLTRRRIRIANSAEAFDAIVATLPASSSRRLTPRASTCSF